MLSMLNYPPASRCVCVCTFIPTYIHIYICAACGICVRVCCVCMHLHVCALLDHLEYRSPTTYPCIQSISQHPSSYVSLFSFTLFRLYTLLSLFLVASYMVIVSSRTQNLPLFPSPLHNDHLLHVNIILEGGEHFQNSLYYVKYSRCSYGTLWHLWYRVRALDLTC